MTETNKLFDNIMWLARAKDNVLTLFTSKPEKGSDGWVSSFEKGTFITLGDKSMKKYPNIKWEDKEPTEVLLLPFGKEHSTELETSVIESSVIEPKDNEKKSDSIWISKDEANPTVEWYAKRTIGRAAYGKAYCYLFTDNHGKVSVGTSTDMYTDLDNDRHLDKNYYLSYSEARDIADRKNETIIAKDDKDNLFGKDLAKQIKKEVNHVPFFRPRRK